jgi:hypothetical protein
METVDKNTNTISNASFEMLAKQIFNHLLVPRMFLRLRYLLTVVKAGGGRTPSQPYAPQTRKNISDVHL